jgi:uncharacterized membrane protein YdjX (TVP38/TMEM64 family)
MRKLLIIYSMALPFLLFVGAGVGTAWAIGLANQNLDMSLGSLGMLLAVFAVLSAVGLLPTAWVAMFLGYFCGWGTFIMFVIYYGLAAWLGRAVGRRCAVALLENSRIARIWRVLGLQNSHTPQLVVFYTRLSPVVPFAVANIMLSMVDISTPRFLGWSCLGAIPRALCVFIIAAQAAAFVDARNGGGVWNATLGAALLVLSCFGLDFTRNKGTGKQTPL